MSKVTVVGAGKYGSTTVQRIAEWDIVDEVVMTDIVEGLPQGLEPGEAWITGKVDPAVGPLLQDIGWKKVRGDANSLLKPTTAGS